MPNANARLTALCGLVYAVLAVAVTIMWAASESFQTVALSIAAALVVGSYLAVLHRTPKGHARAGTNDPNVDYYVEEDSKACLADAAKHGKSLSNRRTTVLSWFSLVMELGCFLRTVLVGDHIWPSGSVLLPGESPSPTPFNYLSCSIFTEHNSRLPCSDSNRP